jgi:hypothetical protein
MNKVSSASAPAALVAVLLALLLLPAGAQAATCSDHATQAAAQAAADTRDGDGDGRYCESLPCPCAGGSSAGASPPTPAAAPAAAPEASCVKTGRVQPIGFSSTKYPNIKEHFDRGVKAGWPQILVVNRRGTEGRRDRLLEGYETRDGYDRDEYPPAVGRGAGRKALMRGTKPVGWRATVEYVPSSENRSHGSTMGAKLRRFCDGQRFRYVFY